MTVYIHVECCWSVFAYHKFAVYFGLPNAVYHYSLCASACRNTSCRGLTWLANCWRQVVVVVVVGKGNSDEGRQWEGCGTKERKKEGTEWGMAGWWQPMFALSHDLAYIKRLNSSNHFGPLWLPHPKHLPSPRIFNFSIRILNTKKKMKLIKFRHKL